MSEPKDTDEAASGGSALTEVLERIYALADYHGKQAVYYEPFGAQNPVTVFHREVVKTLMDTAAMCSNG